MITFDWSSFAFGRVVVVILRACPWWNSDSVGSGVRSCDLIVSKVKLKLRIQRLMKKSGLDCTGPLRSAYGDHYWKSDRLVYALGKFQAHVVESLLHVVFRKRCYSWIAKVGFLVVLTVVFCWGNAVAEGEVVGGQDYISWLMLSLVKGSSSVEA